MISSLLFVLTPSDSMTSHELEMAAREIGMVYPHEVLVYEEREERDEEEVQEGVVNHD